MEKQHYNLILPCRLPFPTSVVDDYLRSTSVSAVVVKKF